MAEGLTGEGSNILTTDRMLWMVIPVSLDEGSFSRQNVTLNFQCVLPEMNLHARNNFKVTLGNQYSRDNHRQPFGKRQLSSGGPEGLKRVLRTFSIRRHISQGLTNPENLALTSSDLPRQHGQRK